MPIFNLVPCGRCGKRLHYVYQPGMTFKLSAWSCQGCGHKITVWEMDRKMEVERLSMNKNQAQDPLFQPVSKLRGNLVDDGFLAPVAATVGGEELDDIPDLSELFKT